LELALARELALELTFELTFKLTLTLTLRHCKSPRVVKTHRRSQSLIFCVGD
jgi:hypothetical protein